MQALKRQVGPELAPGVVQRLVERAACRAEALGEDVDRDALEREGDEHGALMGGQGGRDRLRTAREQLGVSASAPGPRRAPRRAPSRRRSSATSRPCQARRRAFTAASRSANLYAHVVKRLWPR